MIATVEDFHTEDGCHKHPTPSIVAEGSCCVCDAEEPCRDVELAVIEWLWDNARCTSAVREDYCGEPAVFIRTHRVEALCPEHLAEMVEDEKADRRLQEIKDGER